VILAQFVCLQLLDVLTTLLFLARGVAEANPLVRPLLGAAAHPTLGLALVKTAGILLAFYAWRSGRVRLLRRVNLFYVLCLAWNLAALVAARHAA
jgi:hypothetical protein